MPNGQDLTPIAPRTIIHKKQTKREKKLNRLSSAGADRACSVGAPTATAALRKLRHAELIAFAQSKDGNRIRRDPWRTCEKRMGVRHA